MCISAGQSLRGGTRLPNGRALGPSSDWSFVTPADRRGLGLCRSSKASRRSERCTLRRARTTSIRSPARLRLWRRRTPGPADLLLEVRASGVLQEWPRRRAPPQPLSSVVIGRHPEASSCCRRAMGRQGAPCSSTECRLITTEERPVAAVYSEASSDRDTCSDPPASVPIRCHRLGGRDARAVRDFTPGPGETARGAAPPGRWQGVNAGPGRSTTPHPARSGRDTGPGPGRSTAPPPGPPTATCSAGGLRPRWGAGLAAGPWVAGGRGPGAGAWRPGSRRGCGAGPAAPAGVWAGPWWWPTGPLAGAQQVWPGPGGCRGAAGRAGRCRARWLAGPGGLRPPRGDGTPWGALPGCARPPPAGAGAPGSSGRQDVLSPGAGSSVPGRPAGTRPGAAEQRGAAGHGSSDGRGSD